MEVHSGSENEDDTEDQDTVDELIEKKMSLIKKVGARASVSAEVYGSYNKKENFKPKFIQKSEAQYKRISQCVVHSFMFNSLDEKDLQTVINAMEEKKVNSCETVITQGENGEVLYIIESGTLDCYKVFDKEEGEKYLKTYHPGETFGELALLYNAPRAATIRANENCVLWALDRETFNHIVKDAAMKKRVKYENFLSSVDILKSIDSYEITQISEALTVENYKAGDQIIKIDEEGDKFFMLEDGQAFASKKFSEDESEETVVKEYKTGDYFGELALIKNELRAANVYAKV